MLLDLGRDTVSGGRELSGQVSSSVLTASGNKLGSLLEKTGAERMTQKGGPPRDADPGHVQSEGARVGAL